MSNSPFGSAGFEANRFWAVIGFSAVQDAGEVDSALNGISSRLGPLTETDLVGFVERLHEALFRIDRKILARVPVTLASGLEFPQSSDHFLYARCACILAGREAYETVWRSDAGFARFVAPSVQGAESLLYIASEEYKDRTGMSVDIRNFFPIESMSNAEGWTG
ncbi:MULTISPECIES: DUF4240 domain-containing protein [Saccharothrix]|uniref:DUF4240 domain-containing protein n=1 Tax=Saccharothrix TaxID=2071 RepID=UPI00093C102D|nr:DUF4240 domain-containing protein [Saccharothrix sp. CB00851]